LRPDPFPLVLKEGAVAWAGGADGTLASHGHGLYAHDARWLRRWRWRWPADLDRLRLDGRGPSRLRERLSRIRSGGRELGRAGPRETLAIERELELRDDGFDERLRARAPADVGARLAATLAFDARVEDVFEVRGYVEPVARRVEVERTDRRLCVRSHAPDGVEDAVEVRVEAPDGVDVALREDGLTLEARLKPGAEFVVTVRVRLERRRTDAVRDGDASPGAPGAEARARPAARLDELAPGPRVALPDAGAWRAALLGDGTPERLAPGDAALALGAADDLRALLLPTSFGPVPAAGVPWYVAPFGRDATFACLLTPAAREAARATLRLLAALQGRTHDPRRAEAPGKIPHEMRTGAATRLGRTPHGPHYGSVDATPLWVLLLAQRVRDGDEELLFELAPALRAALGFLREAGRDDPDGLLRFDVGEGGYRVQSWKDAGDSLCHADGRLAEGSVAVVEVQGYAEAAWREAAPLLRRLGDEAGAAEAEARASRVRAALAGRFFLPELGPAGCHALALDGDDAPLAVLSSDPGHLLWTGSVADEEAEAVAEALRSPALWSGWGVRTLGEGERRYAAVSYHSGSVWPHDTAMFALGLARYGRIDAAREVARAVLDLAEARPDRRAPELIAGDRRDDGPPAAYPDACRLQAWDAAAVLAMARLLAYTAAERR
jgi:glycogen debranching enzyme